MQNETFWAYNCSDSYSDITADNVCCVRRLGLLQAKSVKQTKKSITIVWKKVKGAKRYVIFSNRCGKKKYMKKYKTVTAVKVTLKKAAGIKLRKGTYYKAIIVALDKDNKVITTSKIIHMTTKGGRFGNHKALKSRAKKKGSCKVYIYAQNGVSKVIRVTVK